MRHDQFNTAAATNLDARFRSLQAASNAAEAANEKAMNKSEDATKGKIDALEALLTGSINDIRGQIATLTSRQDRAEGASKGVVDSSFDRRSQAGMVVAIFSLVALLVSMLVGGMLFVVSHGSPPPYSPAAYSAPAPTVASPAGAPLGQK